jgi:hypothetical protein
MSLQLESDLKEAFASRASAIPGAAFDRVRSVDYRPRSRRVPRPVQFTALAGAATAGAVTVSTFFGGAEPAFAGWSASPTAGSNAQLSAAGTACLQHLADLPTVPGATAPSGWQVELTDVRGPFSFAVYRDSSGADDATCFTGPGFTITRRVMPGGGDEMSVGGVDGGPAAGSASGGAPVSASGGAPVSASGGAPVSASGGPPVSASGGAPVSASGTSDSASGMSVTAAGAAGPGRGTVEMQGVGGLSGAIGQFDVAHLALPSGGHYTIVEGRTQPDVTAVSIVRDDGTSVSATTGNGWFVAWWPEDHNAVSATVTTKSGATSEDLTLPTPPRVITNGACGGTGPGPVTCTAHTP